MAEGCSEVLRRTRSRESGVAALEFALMLPFLVLLIFGIIEFGRGWNAKITVTHAAREGARVMALDTGDPVAAAKAANGGLDSAQMSVSTTGGPCTPANSGTAVSVTVSYPVVYEIPLFGSGTWTVSDTATMRCGG